MSKAGLDNRHRNHDGEISHKHGNTLIGTLRKIYRQSFAAGYPATEKLSEVLDPAARFSRSRSPQQRSVLARKPVNSEQVSCSMVPTSVVQRALVDGDSIPFDLGVFFLEQQVRARFGQPATRVRGRVREMKGTFSGGTAASLRLGEPLIGRLQAKAGLTFTLENG